MRRATVEDLDLYYNAGAIFFAKQDFPRSLACYQRFLAERDDPLARVRVKQMLAWQLGAEAP
jgi:hypothetical protein